MNRNLPFKQNKLTARTLKNFFQLWRRLIEPPGSIRNEEQRRLSRAFSAILLMVLPLIILIGMIVMPIVEGRSDIWQSATFQPALLAAVVSIFAYGLNRSGQYYPAVGIYIFIFVFSPWWVVVRNETAPILPIAILMVGGTLMASTLATGPYILYGTAIGSAASIVLLPVVLPNVHLLDIAGILSVIVNLNVMIVIFDFYRNRLEADRQSVLATTNIDLRDSIDYSENRLDQLVNTLVSFGALDFSVRAPIGENGDMFDALATGLNALGEELQATTVSKTYLDDIIGSMTDALIVISPEGNIQTVNNATLRILGYTEKELIGQPIRKIFARGALEKVNDLDYNKVAQGTPPGIVEGEFLNRNGQKIPVLYSCSAVITATGSNQGTVCVAHDISARMRTGRLLNALNNASSAMEHILEPDEIFNAIGNELKRSGFSCSVFIFDREREVLFPKFFTFDSKAVQFAEKLLGIKARELPIPMRAVDDFWRVLSTGNTVYTSGIESNTRQVLPKPFKQLAGQIVRTLDIQTSIITPLFLGDEIDGLLAVHSNDLIEDDIPSITAFSNQVSAAWRKVNLLKKLEVSLDEKKWAEAELIKHRDHLEELVALRTQELEAANEELSNFAYVVSHDLKAPLRAISQLSSWIVEDYAQYIDQNGQDKLSLLIDRTKHMHNLIEDILQYSRIGRVTEKMTDVDLNKKVREIINLLAPPETIHIIIDKPLPVVTGESTHITQVFQNLLSNAIRYIDKPDGYIKINSEKRKGEWLFSVVDNGPGIEEKYHEKIFQMFQTLGIRKDVDSTGIGLALVKRIVEKWGGSVWVESEMGRGSTFFFTMPENK